ncbi:hypothetical protein EW146_g5133 [Bondarzewia mesenterica]|uniref:NmrA-like domain-containing protein n=1 Tax=Bondarzewia mesenterica TaxID=1095465 RepID=A0A4S4LSD0_9AGAM|nr:hypothetical protein EW146_g5133 [Bondarzewia mesenterica]
MADLVVKNVVVFGASGLVGRHVLSALSTVPNDLNVTVVTRASSGSKSSHNFPPTVKVLQIDYTPNSIRKALHNQDAAVSVFDLLITPGTGDLERTIIDLAVEEGVKLFIPSVFDVDPTEGNPGLEKLESLGIWQHKIANALYLKKLGEEGKITWTSIVCNFFLDMKPHGPVHTLSGLGYFGFDMDARKVLLYDGGAHPIGSVTVKRAGEAIIKVLLQPSLFANKAVYLSTLTVSQLNVLAELERVTGATFQKETVSSKELIAKKG